MQTSYLTLIMSQIDGFKLNHYYPGWVGGEIIRLNSVQLDLTELANWN